MKTRYLILLTALACEPLPADPNGEQPEPAQEPVDVTKQPGIAFDPVKPNVMLLIDRSGSMREPVSCTGGLCPSKWQQLVGLGVYLSEAKAHARLGLTMFPSGSGGACDVSTSVRLAPSDAPDIDEQILSIVQSATPGGRTPLKDALDAVATFGELDDPERDNILIVLTDGAPNCACPDHDQLCERDEATEAVRRLSELEPAIDVDIVGFGLAEDAHDTLNEMALAAGDDGYYRTETIEELLETLFTLGVQKAPCKFDLDELPEPDDLLVLVDGSEVAACPARLCADGYSYDPAAGTVIFNGQSCAALRDGQPHQVWFETRS